MTWKYRSFSGQSAMNNNSYCGALFWLVLWRLLLYLFIYLFIYLLWIKFSFNVMKNLTIGFTLLSLLIAQKCGYTGEMDWLTHGSFWYLFCIYYSGFILYSPLRVYSVFTTQGLFCIQHSWFIPYSLLMFYSAFMRHVFSCIHHSRLSGAMRLLMHLADLWKQLYVNCPRFFLFLVT